MFGEGSGGNCTPIIPVRLEGGGPISDKTFSRSDVFSIWGLSEGENDERDWIVWGQLRDGRWFKARGGCDYTGWDCQAGNSGSTAGSANDLVRFGMTNDERSRFGIVLTEEMQIVDEAA